MSRSWRYPVTGSRTNLRTLSGCQGYVSVLQQDSVQGPDLDYERLKLNFHHSKCCSAVCYRHCTMSRSWRYPVTGSRTNLRTLSGCQGYVSVLQQDSVQGPDLDYERFKLNFHHSKCCSEVCQRHCTMSRSWRYPVTGSRTNLRTLSGCQG